MGFCGILESGSGMAPVKQIVLPEIKRERLAAPMSKKKPITVLNADHEELESTYVRRAQGLVMKGRARFIDENTIILEEKDVPPCPPDKNNKIIAGDRVDLRKTQSNTPVGVSRLEDKIMDNKIFTNNDINEEDVENCTVTGKLTDVEIFEELKLMRAQLLDSHELELVYKAISDAINFITCCGDCNVDLNDVHNGTMSTIINVNSDREETIRKLMDIYSSLLEKISK